ncbi:ABC transporter permease [Paenibacillus oralis]|nr:ABC transporter permease [Paenibacillus oralis]
MREKRWATVLVLAGILLMCFGSGFSEAANQAWRESGGSVGPDRWTIYALPDSGGANGDSGFTLQQAERLDEKWQGEVAYAAGIPDDIPLKARFQARTGRIAGIGGAFSDFTTLRLREGRLFHQESANGNSWEIVLSDAFAEKLFGSANAVGLEVRLLDKMFRVVGVYRSDDDLLRWTTGGALPDALVPIGALAELQPQLRVQAIELQAAGEGDAGREQAVRSALTESGFATSNYSLRSGVREWALNAQLPRLIPFAAGVMAIGSCIARMRRLIQAAIPRLRVGLEPLPAAIPEQSDRRRRVLLGMAAAFAASGAAAVMMWLLIRYPFYVPRELVPERWIDLGFYQSKLMTLWNEHPVLSQAALSPFDRTGEQLGRLIGGLSAAGLLAGLPLLRIGLRQWRLLGLTPSAALIRVCGGMTGAVFLTGLASAASGIPQAMRPGLITALLGCCAIFATNIHMKRKDDEGNEENEL